MRSRPSTRMLALLVVSLAAGSLNAFAQTAQITGRVTDASGAVVPGASITVRNVATGAERVTATNDGGYWTAPLLPPGEYRVTVGHAGFREIVRSGVVLEVDQRAELNFTLEVGAVAERIEVEAAVTQLNTVEASRGQVIDNRRIVELPLNGRNYNELALLSSGTVAPLGAARYGGFSAGGMRVTQNNFMLDGVDNNGIELAGAQRRSDMVQPSIDAIQEFKVQTNAYAAEYGRAMGAVVNATTKSGSNELHGTAFEFLRNEILDAKNFFDPPDRPKPPFKRNQYGFALGGPIWIPGLFNGRNRAFFFGDFEGTRIRVSNTNTSTIPTLAMRGGDFSELRAQRNVTILDPTTNAAFPGNVIPSSRMDPVARALVDLYPSPMNDKVVSNFVYQSPAPQDVAKFDVRADVHLGTKDTWSWRLSQQDADIPAPLNLPPPAYGGGALDSAITGINTGTSWSHIWTPRLIMSVRAAWNYGYFERDSPKQAGGELLNKKYGIKAGTDLPGGFSQMNITGYAALGTGAFNPVQRDSQNRQVAGDLTWTHGTHTVKVGSSVLRSQNNIFNINNELGGPFQFNGRYTRDGMADFLLGMASQFTWSTRTQVNLRSWNIGAYAQDDWKVTPSLTLNVGMRYEVVLPFIDKRDRMGIFDNWTDPNNPRLIYAGTEGTDRYNRAMFATDKNNLMPRIGFAYKLGSRTVVRSGFGSFYGYLEPYGDAEYLLGNPPYAYGVTLASSATVPALRLQNGPPDGALELARATGLTLIAYERKPEMGHAYQWNLSVQREAGRDWLFEVGYSGSRGVHLLRRYDDNFSPPGAGDINSKRRYRSVAIPGTSIVTSPLGPVYGYHADGNSIYHALDAKLEKRFSSGFTLLTSYTLSRNIGNTCGNAAAGNTTGCGFQDLRNLRAERSVDNQDQPHRFVGSGVYELPFGKGRRWGSTLPGVIRGIVDGWSTGSIVYWSSGLPYSPTVQGNPANTGTFDVVNRPNLVGNVWDGPRTLDRDFNTAAFAANAQYTVGNAGRNILRGRSHFNWDFSALRDFALREQLRLQFRFEAFHFSNTPRFGQAGAVLGTANFGRITSADVPRNLQFGLKLIW